MAVSCRGEGFFVPVHDRGAVLKGMKHQWDELCVRCAVRTKKTLQPGTFPRCSRQEGARSARRLRMRWRGKNYIAAEFSGTILMFNARITLAMVA